MRAFKFRLEALITVREAELNKALSRYGKAMNARKRKEDQIAVGMQGYSYLADQLGESRTKIFSVVQQGPILQAMESQKAFIIRAREELELLQKNERSYLNAYLEAKKKLDILLK